MNSSELWHARGAPNAAGLRTVGEHERSGADAGRSAQRRRADGLRRSVVAVVAVE